MSSDLTRVSFNLTWRGNANLEYIERTEHTGHTETIHRALRLYAYLLETQEAGLDLLTRDSEGEITKLAWP